MNNQLDSFCLITNGAFLPRLVSRSRWNLLRQSNLSLKKQLSFIPTARPNIRSYFNLSTAATAPKASLNCHKNLWTTTDKSCIQNPISIVKDHETWIHTLYRWPLFQFGFCFIDIFLLCYLFSSKSEHFAFE